MSIVTNIKSSFSYLAFRYTQPKVLFGALAVIAILSWIAVFASAKSDAAKIYFFDVGQGDAIFIELMDGRQILIDGGPDERVLEKLNKVMPFWDREIDIMIATHADADHLAGLVRALAHYGFGTIIWNGIAAETRVFKEWKEAADSEGAEVLVGRCCMRFTLSDNAFFEILWPNDSPPYEGGVLRPQSEGGGSQNNYSLVIRFVDGNESFLFTGDIERQVEYAIVQQNFNLQSDILKIPHHGSKTSSSELFLDAVRPKTAIISAGRNNSYGHPHPAILQRLKNYAIDVRRTDLEGDIIYASK